MTHPQGEADPAEVDAADTSSRPAPGTAIAIGLGAGALSGLFGVGGGILIVPALTILARMEQRLAHGTSLAATAPLAAAALVGYALAGEVDWLVALLMLTGSLLGAVLGTHLLGRLPVGILRWGFALLLVLTAVRMLIAVPEGPGVVAIDPLAAGGLASIGLFTGSVAGLMGVGGGVIMVPAQTVLFEVSAAMARGTSLAVIVPTAVVGSVRNVRKGNTDLRTAGVVAGAGVLSSFVASQVSIGLDDRLSAVLFGGLLLVAAVRLVLSNQRTETTISST